MGKNNLKPSGQSIPKQKNQVETGKITPSKAGQSHKAKFDQLLDDAVLGFKKK